MLTDYEDRIYCAPSPAEVKGKQDKQQQQEQAVQKGTGALFAAARLLRCLHARTAALLHCTLPTLPASAPKPYPNPRSQYSIPLQESKSLRPLPSPSPVLPGPGPTARTTDPWSTTHTLRTYHHQVLIAPTAAAAKPHID
jgi:hypothetical protein